jgi:hypothetical protein
MGYERPPNFMARLRRSLWAAGGARAALTALVILASALGVMRLVAVAPPLPARHPPVPALTVDSTVSTDSAGAAKDSAASAESGP